ncbi:DUF2796 domain-containing protein [Reinekea sp.]|uniref:DUF2796 domain-containing protein n=1 Tax=Reinekea sp. TaxID=1970455 RepID=UPI0025797519|nr:DUF2796 domain-containing protein [Reinekea sp.]
MKRLFLSTALVAVSINPLNAAENRQHDAHEHGAAMLGMAQQGKLIQMELDSPAFNMVGFEHTPSNANEEEKVALMLAQLKMGSILFTFPAAAKCQLVNVDISSGLFEASHSDENDHDSDSDHSDDEDDHGSVSDHSDDEDDHENDHENDSGHSDIEASWTYSCENPLLVRKVEFPLFSYFENLTDLDVDFIMDAGQGSIELSPGNSVISF